jgi:hypothetical protein
MRVAAAKNSKTPVPRREQMLYERARSAAMRDAFPKIGQLRFELTFGGTRSLQPSPQVHTLYPAAAAFFRFACPCADCNGDFDLTDPVIALVKDGVAASRGQLVCNGTRRDRPLGSAACSVRLDYRIKSI